MVAAVIAGGAIALNDFQDDRIGTISETTVTNESVTLTNGTAVAVANNYVVSITLVETNNTEPAYEPLSTSNYTTDRLESFQPARINMSGQPNATATALVTYTYRDELSTYDANVTSEGLEGLSNATSYLSTIGTLLGVAALILVVMGAFWFAGKLY